MCVSVNDEEKDVEHKKKKGVKIIRAICGCTRDTHYEMNGAK